LHASSLSFEIEDKKYKLEAPLSQELKHILSQLNQNKN
jgi:hypothetical protein